MSGPGPAPDELALTWEGGRRFATQVGAVRVVLDGERTAGPSPVQGLFLALAGCMAIDVVDILQKGRYPLEGLRARVSGERRAEPPRYLQRVDLHFELQGAVPPDRAERALQLSRERYCSVWHSLRPDVDFRTSFEILPAVPTPVAGATDRG